MICHKTFSHTDSLAAWVKSHYPCQKMSLVQSVLLFVLQKILQVHIAQEPIQTTEQMVKYKFGRW